MATVTHAKANMFPPNLYDYGVVADWNGTTGTDNSTAIQAAITAAISTNSGLLQIPMGKGQRYYVGTKLNINIGNFSVTGDAPVQNLGGGDKKSYITGAVGIGAILDYGNGVNVSTGAFYLDGIAFYKTGTKITSAVKISMDNNGPHRGITFRNISASGFVNAIELNPPTGGNLSAANLDVESCNFTGCTNAVNAVKECEGLRFVGNQSEDGGCIIGKFTAGITITDNMFESNTDCINIDSDAPNVFFENNYLEGCLGNYVLRVKGGNSYSTIEIGKNYSLNTVTSTDIYLIEGVIRANLKHREFLLSRSSPITLKDVYLVQGSSFKGHGFYFVPANNFSGYLLAHEYANTPIASATSVVLNNLGTDVQQTPFGGTATGLSITGYNTSNDKTLTISYTSSDVLVFCALVSVINASGQKPQVRFFDTSNNEIRVTGENRFYKIHDNEWYLYTTSVKPTTTGTTIKVRWGSDEEVVSPTSNTLKIAAIGLYKVPAGDFETLNSTSRVYIKPFNPFNKVAGEISLGYVAKTSTYTITVNDYFIDCTTGTFTVTLPTAVGITGKIYVVKNSGTGTVTIATTSSQTIDGATTKTLSVQYSSYTVISDGANWKIY